VPGIARHACVSRAGQVRAAVLRELPHRPVVEGASRSHAVSATAEGGKRVNQPTGVGEEREGNQMAEFFTALAVRLHSALADVREREEGQGLVEYVTLVALIALGLFVAIIFFRNQLGSIFSLITDKISSQLP